MKNNFSIPLRIAKFGGTSVADFHSMNRSIDIVLSNPKVRLVVLSASANITNILLSLSEVNGIKQRNYYLNKIRYIQYKILNNLNKKKTIKRKIDSMINKIGFLSKKTNNINISLALIDELISYGEIMSSTLFVEIMRQRNVLVKWFDARKVMYTNDKFGNAEPNNHLIKIKTNNLLLPLLRKVLVVTQGFIGVEPRGRTTTLGRGGSDYTATILGEALNVEQIDIWTDVPGIYAIDPNIVPQAKLFKKISFDKLAKMANFGAKIIHPSAILPIARSKIPVFVGSSKEPNIGGTIITNNSKKLAPFLAIVLRRYQIALNLNNELNILNEKFFFEKILNILLKYKILSDIIISKYNTRLILDFNFFSRNKKDYLINIIKTKLSYFQTIKLEENLALTTIIGNKLSFSYKNKRKISRVLSQFKVFFNFFDNINFNFYFLILDKDAKKILKMLNNILFK